MNLIRLENVAIGYHHQAIMTKINFALQAGAMTCLCLLYTSPSPRDLSTSRMPSSA